MPCCGKASVSKKLVERKYTPETIEKMRQGALNRIRPASIGQDWRRSTEARKWEKQVKENWHNECAITGNKFNFEMHHFYSGARLVCSARSCFAYAQQNTDNNLKLRDTFLYHPSNGILLDKTLHVDFHKKFGYTKNTIDQFQTYVETLKTSISSQAQQECWEGPETRVYNLSLLPSLQLEKIMKLHERLGEIKGHLQQFFYECEAFSYDIVRHSKEIWRSRDKEPCYNKKEHFNAPIPYAWSCWCIWWLIILSYA